MLPLAWANDPNPLTALFRQAYAQFRAVLADQYAPGSAGMATDTDARKAADSIAPQLHDISARLRRSASALRSPGTPDLPNILLYAFAAVADEALINTDWPGAPGWSARLLERNEFKTQLAGQRLFERIREAARAPRSRGNIDIAELYLDCLNLGFKGAYRHANQQHGDHGSANELVLMRQDLFQFVHQRSNALGDERYRLGEPPGHNLLRADPPRLSLADRIDWWMVVLAALAVPLLASTAIWVFVSAQPAAALHAIIASAERGLLP